MPISTTTGHMPNNLVITLRSPPIYQTTLIIKIRQGIWLPHIRFFFLLCKGRLESVFFRHRYYQHCSHYNFQKIFLVLKSEMKFNHSCRTNNVSRDKLQFYEWTYNSLFSWLLINFERRISSWKHLRKNTGSINIVPKMVAADEPSNKIGSTCGLSQGVHVA